VIAMGGMANAFFWHKEEKWRRMLYLCAGLATGLGSLFLFLMAFGVREDFQESYITGNILYASAAPPLSLVRFITFCLAYDLRWYEAGAVAWLLYVLTGLYRRWLRQEAYRKAANQHRAVVQRPSFYDLFVFSIFAASLYAVDRPGREFSHYLVFLLFPFALLSARILTWTLPAVKNATNPGSKPAVLRTALLFILFTLLLPFFFRSKELRPPFQSESWMAHMPKRLKCPACRLVNRFAQAGDLVTVWGWAPELYVLTGTIPASREPQTPYQMTPGGPLLDYFQRRYMEDLRLHPPKLFIDAVGPGQFAYPDRDANGFETFPALREYVTSNFYLAGDVDGVRVFARRDASTRARLTVPSLIR